MIRSVHEAELQCVSEIRVGPAYIGRTINLFRHEDSLAISAMHGIVHAEIVIPERALVEFAADVLACLTATQRADVLTRALGIAPAEEDEDDDAGCPVDDPSCTSRSDECHDACEAPEDDSADPLACIECGQRPHARDCGQAHHRSPEAAGAALDAAMRRGPR